MRAYHRVDPLMDERKGHYTPAQLGAFIKVQLLAGRQIERGRFKSLKALTGALPAAYARLVPFLVDQGDLVVDKRSGTAYLDGWDEWQEGDLTVRDRMAKLRNKRRHPTVTDAVSNTVTEPSPTATRSSVSVSESPPESAAALSPPRGARAPTPLDDAITWFDEHEMIRPRAGNGHQQMLEELLVQHDPPTVRQAMTGAKAKGARTPREVILGAANLLERIPGRSGARDESARRPIGFGQPTGFSYDAAIAERNETAPWKRQRETDR